MPATNKAVRYQTPVAVFSDYPMHYLAVPASAVRALGGKFRARLVCTINGGLKFYCGLNPLGEGLGYITLSRKRLEELGATLGDRVKVELKADQSKYGMVVPAEFREVLRQDEEARQRFKALLPGKQRTLLHYVAGTSDVDRRIDRSLRLLANLKRLPPGKETIPGIFGRAAGPGAGRW